MTKTCARCGCEFDGHHRAKYCPDCRPVAKREYNRRRYYDNREQELVRARCWYAQNRERLRKYYRRRYVTRKLAVLRGE